VTRTHVFAKAAAADLRAIARYTIDQWGEAQARSYVGQLEDAATAVATGRGAFKDLGSLIPGLRSRQAGSHYIFCLVRAGRPALVLAILHERMDLMARLQDRLRV
jgi:plasmid stabilization system protein ParE